MMTINKFEASAAVAANVENTTFKLEIIGVGAAFQATMTAFGDQFHGVSYQAKSEEEVKADFESFKNGFLKLQRLVAEGIDRNVPAEKAITLKEARIMAGVHPVILAERLGISAGYLKRLEEGEAKQGLSWTQSLVWYQSIALEGMKMDFINWALEQQKCT
ncbi:hypothetical protein ACTL32_09470 [Planococcus sp. FY231025]|uniref:hypothetical protein n=1 Tax=Planococcus sp. FY231025 TaxID=3455699 RepID=UPI003F8F14BA